MNRIALLIICILSVSTALSQSINLEDTVYYSKDWKRVRAKVASYYRPPVTKRDSTHYAISYYRSDQTLYYTGFVKAVKLDYHSSIEPSVAIEDGYFTYYWKNGKTKRSEGMMADNYRVQTWKYYYDTTGLLRASEDFYKGQPFAYQTSFYSNGVSKRE
jgi:hypothetical protein